MGDVTTMIGENFVNISSVEMVEKLNGRINFKFNLKKYSGNFNLEVISDYYQKDIVKYLNELTDGLKKEKT